MLHTHFVAPLQAAWPQVQHTLHVVKVRLFLGLLLDGLFPWDPRTPNIGITSEPAWDTHTSVGTTSSTPLPLSLGSPNRPLRGRNSICLGVTYLGALVEDHIAFSTPAGGQHTLCHTMRRCLSCCQSEDIFSR